jgi:hypothetical protein
MNSEIEEGKGLQRLLLAKLRASIHEFIVMNVEPL